MSHLSDLLEEEGIKKRVSISKESTALKRLLSEELKDEFTEKPLLKTPSPTMPYQVEHGMPGVYETPPPPFKSMPYQKQHGAYGLYDLPEGFLESGQVKKIVADADKLKEEVFGLKPGGKPVLLHEQQALAGAGIASGVIPGIKKYFKDDPLVQEYPGIFKTWETLGAMAKYKVLWAAAGTLGILGKTSEIVAKAKHVGLPFKAISALQYGASGGLIMGAGKLLDNIGMAVTGTKKPDLRTFFGEPAKETAIGVAIFSPAIYGPAAAMTSGGIIMGSRSLAPYIADLWQGKEIDKKNLALDTVLGSAMGVALGYIQGKTYGDLADRFENVLIEKHADYIQSHPGDVWDKISKNVVFSTQEFRGLDLSQRENAVKVAQEIVSQFFPKATIIQTGAPPAEIKDLVAAFQTAPDLAINISKSLTKMEGIPEAIIKGFGETIPPSAIGTTEPYPWSEPYAGAYPWTEKKFPLPGEPAKPIEKTIPIEPSKAKPEAKEKWKTGAERLAWYKKIYGTAEKMQMNKDDVKSIVQQLFDTDGSVKTLDEPQLSTLLDAIKSFGPGGKPPKEPGAPIPFGGPSEEQQFAKIKNIGMSRFIPWGNEKWMRLIGAGGLVDDITYRNKLRILSDINTNRIIENTIHVLNKSATIPDRLKEFFFNKQVPEARRIWELLDTYPDNQSIPDFNELPKVTRDAYDTMRSITEDAIEAENMELTALGEEPIRHVDAYIRRMYTDLARVAWQEHENPKHKAGELPDEIRRYLAKKMPKKVYNPTEFERTAGEEIRQYLEKNLKKSMESMVHYANRKRWLQGPLNTLNNTLDAMRKAGQLKLNQEAEIRDYVNNLIFRYPAKIDTFMNVTLKVPTDLVNKVLEPFGREITNPVRALSGLIRDVFVMPRIAGGALSLPPRILLSTLQLLSFYPEHMVFQGFFHPETPELSRMIDTLANKQLIGQPMDVPMAHLPKMKHFAFLPASKARETVARIAAKTAYFFEKSRGVTDVNKIRHEMEEAISNTILGYNLTDMSRWGGSYTGRAMTVGIANALHRFGVTYSEVFHRAAFGTTIGGERITLNQRRSAFTGLVYHVAFAYAFYKATGINIFKVMYGSALLPVSRQMRMAESFYDLVTATSNWKRKAALKDLWRNTKYAFDPTKAVRDVIEFSQGKQNFLELMLGTKKSKKKMGELF